MKFISATVNYLRNTTVQTRAASQGGGRINDSQRAEDLSKQDGRLGKVDTSIADVAEKAGVNSRFDLADSFMMGDAASSGGSSPMPGGFNPYEHLIGGPGSVGAGVTPPDITMEGLTDFGVSRASGEVMAGMGAGDVSQIAGGIAAGFGKFFGPVGGALANGYAIGVGIDKLYQHVRGQSIGEDLADWVHRDPSGPEEPAPQPAKENPDAGTEPAGTSGGASDGGTPAEESGDSGSSGEGGADGGVSSAESESTGEAESSERADDKGEKADATNTDEASSGADPEVPTTPRPSLGEIYDMFGRTAVSTTARSNPNPAAEDTRGDVTGLGPSLTTTVDTRRSMDGRAAQVGTVEAFGRTVIDSLGTVRPSGETRDGGVSKPGGFNPAA